MRNWILWLHIHGSLLCAAYLILFGVSSLLFNHPLSESHPTSVQWQRNVTVERIDDEARQSQAVTDALGLFGWTIPWETQRVADGSLRFGLARPGRHYTIHVVAVDQATAHVSVDEKREGLSTIILHLHGLMAVPGSRLVSSWAWYTRLCTAVVLFGAISGIYLFASRAQRRAIGLGAAAVAALASLAMMAWAATGG